MMFPYPLALLAVCVLSSSQTAKQPGSEGQKLSIAFDEGAESSVTPALIGLEQSVSDACNSEKLEHFAVFETPRGPTVQEYFSIVPQKTQEQFGFISENIDLPSVLAFQETLPVQDRFLLPAAIIALSNLEYASLFFACGIFKRAQITESSILRLNFRDAHLFLRRAAITILNEPAEFPKCYYLKVNFAATNYILLPFQYMEPILPKIVARVVKWDLNLSALVRGWISGPSATLRAETLLLQHLNVSFSGTVEEFADYFEFSQTDRDKLLAFKDTIISCAGMATCKQTLYYLIAKSSGGYEIKPVDLSRPPEAQLGNEAAEVVFEQSPFLSDMHKDFLHVLLGKSPQYGGLLQFLRYKHASDALIDTFIAKELLYMGPTKEGPKCLSFDLLTALAQYARINASHEILMVIAANGPIKCHNLASCMHALRESYDRELLQVKDRFDYIVQLMVEGSLIDSLSHIFHLELMRLNEILGDRPLVS